MGIPPEGVFYSKEKHTMKEVTFTIPVYAYNLGTGYVPDFAKITMDYNLYTRIHVLEITAKRLGCICEDYMPDGVIRLFEEDSETGELDETKEINPEGVYLRVYPDWLCFRGYIVDAHNNWETHDLYYKDLKIKFNS